MILWILLMAVYIGIPLAIFIFARRLLRTLERRTVAQRDLASLADRLEKLEERIEEIASHQDRLAEGQQFTHKLPASKSHDPMP
jgi:hypothetical protein